MADHYFISYSSVDGFDFAIQLADDLQAGPPPFPVWLDKRKIQPGLAWDDQVAEAIRGCKGMLFVMTADSLDELSVAKEEWSLALRYQKPVIPLRKEALDLPFRLVSRQYIDFTGDYEVGLSRLRLHLEWLDSPEGLLEKMKYRLADAKRDLRRASGDEEKRIQNEITQLEEDIRRQKEIVAHPQQVMEQVERSIQAGIQLAQQPAEPVSPKVQTRFINTPPRLSPAYFQDRYQETKTIAAFLRNDAQRLLAIMGRGGIGKTVLVCRLLKALEAGRLPDDLGEFKAGGIVYLSARGTRDVKYPNLYADLSKLAPASEQARLEALYRDPKISVREQMAALGEVLPSEPVILLLDNLEDAQDGESGDLIDKELDEALHALLTLSHHPIKAILTTRVPPRELMLIEPEHQQRIMLDKGLDSPYAENMLRELDADGRLGLRDAPEALLREARQRTQGNPRALEHLYNILDIDRNATLAEIMANTEHLLPGQVLEVLVGEAYHRLDANAQLVLQALAIYAHPVTPTAIDYLLKPYQQTIDSTPVLNRLVNRQFVRRDAGHYYLHQVDREYALGRIPRDEPGEQDEPDVPPFTCQALRRRAADYFQEVRLPREQWRKLEDLEAQLLEIELRAAGGDYDTAAGVLLEIGFYYLNLWGHYRLLVELHEKLGGKLEDRNLQASCLGSLGLAYSALGEVRKAMDYYEQALVIDREMSDRRGEGADLCNLGSAYSDLGEVRKAMDYYEQALAIAREIGDRSVEGSALGNLGLAYSALGEVRKAIDYYEQALAIAREISDRGGEGAHLGNLGNAYSDLGEVRKAMDYYEQALVIDREISDRRGEGADLGNLGNAYSNLGEVRKAMDYYEQALAIAMEIGDRGGEGNRLSNLGLSFANLGEIEKAIQIQEQALAVAREVEDPYIESCCLNYLGTALADQGKLALAIQRFEAARQIADQITNPEPQLESRIGLATACLFKADYSAALTAAREAAAIDYPKLGYRGQVLLGLAALRLGEKDEAAQAFRDGIHQTEDLLEKMNENYDAWDYQDLALCGLALCGQPDGLPAAVEALRQARRITQAKGIVGRIKRLLHVLEEIDGTGLLAEAVRAAAGEGTTLDPPTHSR